MGKIKGVNFSHQQFEAEDVEFSNDCNFAQVEPFMKQKFKNCKFVGCNLKNNDIDETKNIIEDCNTVQSKTKIKDGKRITTFYDRKTREVINVIEEEIEG